jgi:cupin superfamily acireductone dioxygenase involved in methionine salvage
VQSAREKETKEDELNTLKEAIDELKNQNELLKMDVVYLGAKKRGIEQRRSRSRNRNRERMNRTFDDKDDETLLTFGVLLDHYL